MPERHENEHPGPDDDALDAREERIGELLNEFLDRQRAGNGVSIDEFVASHPDFADDLRRHLDGLRILGRLGSSSDATRLVDRKPGSGAGSSARGSDLGDDVARPSLAGYEILRELGRGGMGIVYKAMQLSTKRAVALKVLLEGPFASESSRRRFEREIELAAQLRHPNIIPIYDSGRSGGRMYYAMEYVHGQPLTDYARDNGLSIDQRVRLFRKICSAVAHAHLRSVVHRDLKPGNILVDSDGEPRVHDFGLAKLGGVHDANMSMTAQIIGTPAYMAPEQVTGDPTAVDARTDVYSLGVILYELLTGQMPYPTGGPLTETLNHICRTEPVRPGRLRRGISQDLETIVAKALHKSKEQRYQSVAALSEDLGRYLAGEPIEARRASALYLIGKAIWPHRYIAAAVALCVALAGAFAWSTMSHHMMLREQNLRDQQQALELQRARQEAEQARIEAEQKVRDAERRRDEEWSRMLAEKLKGFDPVRAARAVGGGAGDVVRGLAPQDPRSLLLRTGVNAAREVGSQLNRFFDSSTELDTAAEQGVADGDESASGESDGAPPATQPTMPPTPPVPVRPPDR